jgi:hypothetical protein
MNTPTPRTLPFSGVPNIRAADTSPYSGTIISARFRMSFTPAV